MRLLVAALVMAALAFPLVAQEPCDADPRWLVVTVAGVRMIDSELQPIGDEEPTEMISGVTVLDRCGRGTLTIHEDEGELRDLGRGRANIWTRHEGIDGYWIYYVRESVHDVCAVLADCVDATLPTVPPR